MLRAHFALIQMPPHHKTLFYPDSFTRGIFWVGMTRQNKVVQGKKARLDQNSYKYGGNFSKEWEIMVR